MCVLSLFPRRSSIHGRGLYCKRNIDGGEMIIEYAGEVIRAALTDKREKYYESKVGYFSFFHVIGGSSVELVSIVQELKKM